MSAPRISAARRLVSAATAAALTATCSAVLVVAPAPAHAAACSVGTVSVASVSGSMTSQKLWFDTGDALVGQYVGYRVTNNGAAPLRDAWAKIGSFSGPQVGLAANENGMYHLGPIAAGASKVAYFYLKPSAATTGESYVVSVHGGRPDVTAADCTETVTGVEAATDIAASANKLTGISVTPASPTRPELGGTVKVTVTGNTGTIGGTAEFWSTAATAANWPATALRLKTVKMTMTGGNTRVDYDRLYWAGLNSSATAYTVEYDFAVGGAYGTAASVYPIQHISSGAQVKHTTLGSTVAGAVEPPLNFTTLSAAVTPDDLPGAGGTADATATVTNTGTGSIILDDIVVTVPATATYVPGSATWNGTLIGDAVTVPAGASENLVFSHEFVVPGSGGTGTLAYQVAFPAGTADYDAQTRGHFGSFQIDTTATDPALAQDDAPALWSTAVGAPPTAVDDTATTPASTPVETDVRANDTDTTGQPLTVTGTTHGANGSVAVDAISGNPVYTPTGPFQGVDTYTYTVTNSDGISATATVTVTVTAPNTAPAYTGAAANTAQSIAHGGTPAALAATDADSDPLSHSVTSGSLPTGIALAADGTFTGAATASGTWTATVTVSDGNGGTDTTTLVITVANAAPAYTSAAANTSQSAPVGTGLDPLAATDPNNDPLSYAVTSGSLPTGIALAADGTFTGTATGTGTWTATVTVSDGNGGTDTTTLVVTVTAVNAAPVFTAATTNTAQTIAYGAAPAALAATDPNSDPLAYAHAGGSLPGGITLAADGTFTGTATASGTFTATITVSDGNGGTDTTTLVVTVANAEPEFTSAATNTSQAVEPGLAPTTLAATDPNGDPIAYAVTSGSLPTGIALAADGTFTGTVSAAGTWTATVTASDNHGGTDTTVLVIAVPNRAPAATADTASTTHGAPARTDVLANDTDPNSDALSVTAVTQGGHGTVGIDPGTGQPVYTPNPGFAGPDTYTYTVSDGSLTDTANVVVTVANAVPAFTSAAANTAQAVAYGTAPVALVATDPNNDPLAYAHTGGSLPGGITLAADGTFTGSAASVGTFTSTITVSDGNGGNDTTTLAITVGNATPAYTAAASNTAQNLTAGSTPGALVAADPDNDPLSHALTGGSLPPGIALAADGTFTGTVSAAGTWTATVTVSDGNGGTGTTTLVITVANTAPSYTAAASNTAQTIPSGGTLTSLAATDANGDSLSHALASGTLPTGTVLAPNGSFTGAATAPGTFTAAITVSDGNGGTGTTTLVVTVSNDPPVFDPTDPLNTNQTVPAGATPAPFAAADPNGDPIAYAVTTGTLPAGLVLNANGTFTGTTSAVGTWTVVVTATDAHGAAATTTLTITVPNTPPAYTAATANTVQTVAPGSAPSPLVATDPNGDPITHAVTGGTLPPGIVLRADGTFTGAVGAAGTWTITATATDPQGAAAVTALTITVGNAAPGYTAAASNTAQVVKRGTAPVALAAADPNGDPLAHAVTGGTLPPGIVLRPDGTFTGTIDQPGTWTAVVRVTDPAGAEGSTTLIVTVINEAPVLAPTEPAGPTDPTGPVTPGTGDGGQTVPAGGTPAPLSATDPDGDPLTYSVVSGALPPGVALNPNGTFTGTTRAVGTWTVTVQAADPFGAIATTTLTITVPNSPPAYTDGQATAVQTAKAGGTFAPLSAVDPNGDPLTYRLVGGQLPPGVTLNLDGTFTGAATLAGRWTALLSVSDPHGGTAVVEMTFGVLGISLTRDPAPVAAPAETAVELKHLRAVPGRDAVLAVVPTGWHGAVVTVVAQPAHGTVRVVDGSVVYTSRAGFSGADSFRYRVDAPGRNGIAGTVQVTVGRLPRTGQPTAALLLAGLVLVGTGAALAAAGRTRRTA